MSFVQPFEARRLFATGLDTGFADGGQLSFPDAFTPDTTAAHNVESGDNGSIFVSGKTAHGNAAIAKYDTNGRLLTAFGANGYAAVPFAVSLMAYDAASGKLYVAGNDADAHGISDHTSVARLRSNGKLDRTFAGGGFDYRLPRPKGDDAFSDTFASTSTETINPLPDGSVLLGVDRATRWRTGSADQDLVLIKLRPNGSYDTRYGTGGITQVLNGYFQPNYASDSTRRARGYRGLFSDVQVDPNGDTRVAIEYADGTRYYREDYPNVYPPLVGRFSVLSRTVTARGKVDRSRSLAWLTGDNTSGASGSGFTYVGFDGRVIHASVPRYSVGPGGLFEQYWYTLNPVAKTRRRLLVRSDPDTSVSVLTRSANGTYVMADSDKRVYRLRADYTVDRTFGDDGVATAKGDFVGLDTPPLYADDLGRVFAFEYTDVLFKYVLDRFD